MGVGLAAGWCPTCVHGLYHIISLWISWWWGRGRGFPAQWAGLWTCGGAVQARLRLQGLARSGQRALARALARPSFHPAHHTLLTAAVDVIH
jgi:hypothetical protein